MRIRWPQTATRDSIFVNQVAVSGAAGTASGEPEQGLYLMLGHVAPPLFEDADAAREFQDSTDGSIEVGVRGAYYLPRIRAIELYQLLGSQLSQLDQAIAYAEQRAQQTQGEHA